MASPLIKRPPEPVEGSVRRKGLGLDRVLKNSVPSLVKKVPDARRARNPRAEAYLSSTLERAGRSATKQMGLFQQAVECGFAFFTLLLRTC